MLQSPHLPPGSPAPPAAAPIGSWCLLPPSLLSSQSPQLSKENACCPFYFTGGVGVGGEEMEVQREDQEFFSAEVGVLRIRTHAIAPRPKLPFGHLSSRNPLTAHPADALGCSS